MMRLSSWLLAVFFACLAGTQGVEAFPRHSQHRTKDGQGKIKRQKYKKRKHRHRKRRRRRKKRRWRRRRRHSHRRRFRVPPLYRIHMPKDPRFQRVISHFRSRQWWFVRSILSRRGLYQKRLIRWIKQERMPWELILLAGIESNYRPLEYSWAKAAGMWQFIPKTGLRFKLKMTSWKDERYNIRKATRAGVRYLRELQREFREWEYAIAAYNCGEICIRRVRRRCPRMSFWKARLRRCGIPRATKQYVARFFAVLYFLRNPAQGKTRIQLKKPFKLRPVHIRGVVSLPTIAEGLRVKVKEMRNWNPELTSWATPPATRYTFFVPPERYRAMRRILKRPSPTYRLKGFRVHSAAAMNRIAKRYNLSVAFLRAMNHLPEGTYPSEKRLLVPLPRGARRWSAKNSHLLSAFATQIMPWSKRLRAFRRRILKLKPQRRRRVCTQVEAGDSYWHIAKRFGLSYRDLMKINHRRTLHPGQWLRLVPNVRCPIKIRFVPNKNRRSAKKAWKQGFPLLYYYPHPNWRHRLVAKHHHKKKRRIRRKKHRHKRRLAVRRRKGCHRVKRGQTLWSIAKQHRLSVHSLKRLNPKYRKVLYVGVWLRMHPNTRCRLD